MARVRRDVRDHESPTPLLAIHRYPQFLFSRAVLCPYIPQLILIVGVDITQVQDLALRFIEPHKFHLSLLLIPV